MIFGKFYRKFGVVIVKILFLCMNFIEILVFCIFGLNYFVNVCFGGCGCLYYIFGNELFY